ncbi:GH12 family glycosyl hydrolase domain-containing protein [Rhizobium sp. LjRoot254]|uniref:GH12 family glycosyl hydrolase domain-containing protein n=1 Tax=Rhizobium sp. LjRoot254 TaxID=3342297 RepID=UPI003ECDB878
MALITLDGDDEWMQSGLYRIKNNVWNKGDLVNGTDFFQSISFSTDSFNQNIVCTWDWGPDGPVRSYPSVMVGYSSNPNATDAVRGLISDIKSFEVSHDVDYSGDTDRFNVTYDLWFRDQYLGNDSTVTTELMVWTHKGDLGDGEKVGTYSDGSYRADIVTYMNEASFNGGALQTWRYIALIPTEDYDEVTLDMKDIIDNLVRKGLVSADDYVNGYEFGSEVAGGKGQLEINSISHSFQTYADGEGRLVEGTRFADDLSGRDNDDVIIGRRGRDTLEGLGGNDVLTGGRARDIFVIDGIGDGVDHITDFRHGRDVIDLGSILGDDSSLGKAAFAGSQFTELEDRLAYDRQTGELYYDADGTGSAYDATLVLVIDNKSAITWSDFAW